ncbi:MAG TPA: hypothetical protein VLF66_07200, partial [Thermoanaerobaculia bacterium]|nr:hypothetical protein [Thermoanaerobaculia bacterium]
MLSRLPPRHPGRTRAPVRPAEGVGRPELVYLVVCAVLSLLLGIQTAHHRWGADFWEHAAVVHDLAEDPADPGHPMLPVDAPHEFAVPSAVLAAAIVAGAGVGVFDAMVVLAALNLGLLLGGVWLFVRTFCPRSRWTPLLALGLALFLWGVNP